MPALAYVPGLGATSNTGELNEQHQLSAKVPMLAQLAQQIDIPYLAVAPGYARLPHGDLDLAITYIEDIFVRRAGRNQLTLVTSSFGAWPVLAYVCACGWPTNLQRLILIDPLVEVQSLYRSLPPLLRELPRFTGFPRKGEHGQPGFWVSGRMVRSMLSPEHDLFDGRLRRLHEHNHKVHILLEQGRASAYKPSASTLKLQRELGLEQTLEPMRSEDL